MTVKTPSASSSACGPRSWGGGEGGCAGRQTQWGVRGWGSGPSAPCAPGEGIRAGPARQVDVIKKAYLQEEERENSDVSPREVGHNIYILALQVPVPPWGPALAV